MRLPSFEGLEVGSREYVRVANRRYYHRHKKQEKARTTQWRKDNQAWWNDYCKKNKKKRQAANRKSDYGITQDQYEAVYKKQKGLCAICKRKLKNPDTDHCHSTGKFRGILCRQCNTLIGLAKENVRVLKNAIKYLRKHNGH